MLVSTAYAQAAGSAAAPGFDVMAFMPLILIFVVFYFLLIRPQQKKLKEHKTMLDAVRRGDRVVTGGGIIGTVVKVGNDDEMTVEIAENVRVRVVRSTINLVLAKTEPARGGDKGGDDKSADTTAAGGPRAEEGGAKGAAIRAISKMLGKK